MWFDNTYGLNINTTPSGWNGYENPNPDGSEKIGANTSSLGDEIWAGRTRDFENAVNPSFDLGDLTSGLLMNIEMDAYTTQADLYAPKQVLNGTTIVPEPVSSTLFLLGGAAMGYANRKKLFGADKRDVHREK